MYKLRKNIEIISKYFLKFFKIIFISLKKTKKKQKIPVLIINNNDRNIKSNKKQNFYFNIKKSLKKEKIDFFELNLSTKNLSIIKNKNIKRIFEQYFNLIDFFKFHHFLNNKIIKTKLKKKNKLYFFFYYIYYFTSLNFFKKNKVKIILYNYSVSMIIPLAVAAKKHNILLIELQHGHIYKNHKAYFFKKKLKSNYLKPDYLITYGNYEKDLLKKTCYIDNKKILPLGCPRYDFLANYNTNTNKIKEKINIPKNKKILFWPTQTHSPIMTKNGENELNANEIFKAISQNENWYLLIKFHPNENAKKSYKFYNSYIKKYNLKNIKILKFSKISTFDCIKISDIVISKGSNVNIEALLMNKKIINLELIKNQDLSQFKILGENSFLKEKGKLNEILKKYNNLEKSKLLEYKKKYFNNFGKASEKIVKFIKKELNNKNP